MVEIIEPILDQLKVACGRRSLDRREASHPAASDEAIGAVVVDIKSAGAEDIAPEGFSFTTKVARIVGFILSALLAYGLQAIPLDSTGESVATLVDDLAGPLLLMPESFIFPALFFLLLARKQAVDPLQTNERLIKSHPGWALWSGLFLLVTCLGVLTLVTTILDVTGTYEV